MGVMVEYSFGESYYYDYYDYYDYYNGYQYTYSDRNKYILYSLAFALNTGYKFVTKSGIYFRTGGTLGFSLDDIGGQKYGASLVLRPDLTFGYYFQKKKLVNVK